MSAIKERSPEVLAGALEAEQALLGALLYDNGAALNCEGVTGDHFVEPIHAKIFGLIMASIERKQLADPTTIIPALKGDPAFDGMGGIGYLADLVDKAPPTSYAADYARAVIDGGIRRNLVQLGQDIAVLGREPGARSAFECLSLVRAELDKLETSATPAEHSMISAPEASAKAIEQMRETARTGKKRGRMTGLRCVDRRLGGLRPGALIVIGGRPGMGKTGVARAIAHGSAARNPDADALFLGIEMGPEEMMQRELSAISWDLAERNHGDPIEYRAMSDGALTHGDFAMLQMAQSKVPSNLILDDCHSLSVEDVRRKVWALQRRRPISVVVIDYLQLMRRPTANGRNDATVLGEMTAGLKQIARQAKTCIVLLSQLSRAVEGRDDKRPQLSDLRESGAIEQDADAVLFPYREVYYVQRNEPKGGGPDHREWEMRCHELRTRLDVICAKQRQGPVGTDTQVYEAGYDHISDEKEEGAR